MKFNWFKKKHIECPDFWKEYLQLFETPKNIEYSKRRFIVFDTETTGFNIRKDRVLSIGAVSIIDNTIHVNNNFERFLFQEIYTPETVEIHGILKNDRYNNKVSETDAIKDFIHYIKDDILIGHHIGYDIGMINESLKRMGVGELKNPTIDTGTLYKKSRHEVYQENQRRYSLDDLCEELHIEKSDRHTASGDALITGLIFLKTVSRLKKKNIITIDELL